MILGNSAKKVFNLYDTVRDGKVTREEMKEYFEKFKKSDPEADADNWIRYLDENQDGFITFEEYAPKMILTAWSI